MLTKDEEGRLAAILGVAQVDTDRGIKIAHDYTVETVLWLAKKLEECNDANQKIMAEMQKQNEEFIAHMETHDL